MASRDIKLMDDILAPRDTITIRYEGKNPFASSAMVVKLIRYVMKVSAKDIWEYDVRWDATGEMREFYGRWQGKRAEDRWTKTYIRIVIQGKQHAKEKTGSCNIDIKGFLETKYTYSNFLQRLFWMFYNKYFYNKHRRQYMEYAKDNMFEMRDKFQRALGIEPR